MDRTGIYGLFNLDGAPLDPDDAAVLSLRPAPDDAGIAHAIDLADPQAIWTDRAEPAATILLGQLDEPAAVAARLGLAAETPVAVLARAALHRFGSDVRRVLAGEWTLLHRERERVTLASSLALRDPLLYARKGARLAVAPDLRLLSRLSWVDDTLDDAGLLFALGRQHLRGAIGNRTVLAGVRALGPGGFATFDAARSEVAPRALPRAAARWRGGFADAMAEAEALLARIVRDRMFGDRIGCMVSGGLDSATLAWLVARDRRPGESVRCLTSAAAPGSGLADETEAAGIVAEHLGLAMDRVVPDAAAAIYRPAAQWFREANAPYLGQRHYLYDAFAAHARAARIPLLFDGQYGEFTLSSPFPLASIRERTRAAMQRWRGGAARSGPSPRDALHVFLAAHRSASLPDPVAAALASPVPRMRMPASGERWGLLPSFEKILKGPVSLGLGSVRLAQPYRDPRLLALFSGFPARMLHRPGFDRAPARHLLAGHLPDSIRLRGKGPAFSPDYGQRLIRQAPDARARIALFRKAGADEWLDLDALDVALARIAGDAARDGQEALTAQLTAMAGEFIAWWRGVS